METTESTLPKIRNQILSIIIAFSVMALGVNFLFITNIKELVQQIDKRLDNHDTKFDKQDERINDLRIEVKTKT